MRQSAAGTCFWRDSTNLAGAAATLPASSARLRAPIGGLRAIDHNRSIPYMLGLRAASIGSTLRSLAALSHSFAGGPALAAASFHSSAAA